MYYLLLYRVKNRHVVGLGAGRRQQPGLLRAGDGGGAARAGQRTARARRERVRRLRAVGLRGPPLHLARALGPTAL